MAGVISSPHQDGYFIAQLVAHIFGIKRWILWRDTPQNCAAMRRTFLTGDGSDCYASTIEGLRLLTEVTFVEARDHLPWFVIPPGTFHAVITLEWSCHLTALFGHSTYFGQAMDLWSLLRIYPTTLEKICPTANLARQQQLWRWAIQPCSGALHARTL